MTDGLSADGRAPDAAAPIVGVVGCGVTGMAVGRVLQQLGIRRAWFDVDRDAARRAARIAGGVVVESLADLAVADVVVIASPPAHAAKAAHLLGEGVHVVCMSDDPDDVATLLALEAVARDHDVSLVVGAAVSPGLSGVLARHLAGQLHLVDEIHVAMHGTGGPSCARQHHGALGGTAMGWHDGEWIVRPGGSGRELCWFPEPVGSADCYRAALADPALLHQAFPEAERISARVSATRRDRLTARLPMLAPPHRDGDRGALRVEVRGSVVGGARVTHLVGAVGRTGDLAGAVAGLFAVACAQGRTRSGVVIAGDDRDLSAWMLRSLADVGVMLQEYTGVATGDLT
jgi:hypothetical protein